MKRFLSISVLLALTALVLAACGGGGSNGGFGGGGTNPSAVFITGEDAPLSSVLSFNITLNTITLNGLSNTPQVLSTPTTVDFARLVGLRSLIGFDAVPADTYSSATITLANNPVITYLNIGANPQTVATMNGTLTTTTVTVNFPTAMVVTKNGLAGLHMDFDLRQSLSAPGGQINGIVNPTIFIQAVSASDEEGQITDFTGGLVSVNTAKNSFVMQGRLDSRKQWMLTRKQILAPPGV